MAYSCFNCEEEKYNLRICKKPKYEAQIQKNLKAYMEKKNSGDDSKGKSRGAPLAVDVRNKTPALSISVRSGKLLEYSSLMEST